MAKEIEKKYLITDPKQAAFEEQMAGATQSSITQAYVDLGKDQERFRIIDQGETGARLTIRVGDGNDEVNITVGFSEEDALSLREMRDEKDIGEIRFRIKNGKGSVTFKGEASEDGSTRREANSDSVPDDLMSRLFDGLTDGEPIRKTRHAIPQGEDLTWEVDVYENRTYKNNPLITAECEFPDQETMNDTPNPPWLLTAGAVDVTDVDAFKNKNLYRGPEEVTQVPEVVAAIGRGKV